MKLVLAQPKDGLPPKAMKLIGSLSMAASSSGSPAASSSDAKSSGDSGSHTIYKFDVTFKNGEIFSAEGNEKGRGAFLKKTDDKSRNPTYPSFLAKLCVAFLSRAKLALGSRAADTRLVYNENNELIGTVSIGLKDFHSMDQQKDHPYDARKLIECNIAEILVALHSYKDDDAHSGNVSPAGVFDADMWFYSLTSIFKGLRVVDTVTKRDPNRQTKIIAVDFARFPILPASSRTYWPTNDGMVETFCKRVFANINQFKALAANPSAKIDGKNITFHHQWYTAMLKQLLAFQPDKLLQDLQNLLGDESFDPTEFDDYQKELLKKRFPLIFTDSILKGEEEITLAQLFLQFFISEYQEFYDAVVRYQGGEHKEVSPIDGSEETVTIKNPSFYEFLLNNPSAYREIMQYFEQRNQETLEKIKSAQQPLFDIVSERSCLALQRAKEIRQARSSISVKAIEEKYQKLEEELIKKDKEAKKQALDEKKEEAADGYTLFDLEKIKSTYHQVFKHSHQGIFNQLWTELKTLLNKLDDSQKPLLEQYLSDLIALVNNYIRDGLIDNSEFRRQLNILLEEKFPPVKMSMPNQELTTELVEIKKKLDNQYFSINFEQHIDADDKDVEQVDELRVLTKKYDEPEVISTFIKSMFKYVDLLKAADFLQLFLYADAEYKGKRSKKLSDYVKNSPENCRQKLAFILSQGGVENTSFNTLFIYQIALAMLNDERIYRDTDMDLLPIKAAIHSKSTERRLEPQLYAKKVQQHILSSSDFPILGSDEVKDKIYNLIYEWATKLHYDTIKEEESTKKQESDFTKLVDEVLDDYMKSTHKSERRSEVLSYAYQANSPVEFLLNTFSHSKGKNSTLTRLMFEKFLMAMVESKYLVEGCEFLYRIKLKGFNIDDLLTGIEHHAKIKLLDLKRASKPDAIASPPRAASSSQQSRQSDPRSKITFANWNTDTSAKFMQNLLYRWVEENSTLFNTIMRKALNDYYKTAKRAWLGRTRYKEVNSVLNNQTLRPYEKLKCLFDHGGTENNSFNTYALLGLYNKLIEQYQNTNKTLFEGFNKYIKCTHENTEKHLALLNSFASQYVYKPAAASSSPAAIASTQAPISLMFRSEVTPEPKPTSVPVSAVPK